MNFADKFISKKIILKKLWSIHGFESTGGTFHWEAILVTNTTGTVKIVDDFSSDSLEEMLAKLDQHIPVSLSLDGKKVLHKKSTNYGAPELKNAIFNADPADFYHQVVNLEGSYLSSYVRKDVLTPLLNAFEARAIKVVTINLGPINVASLLHFVSPDNSRIVSQNYEFTLDRGKWKDYSVTDSTSESTEIGNQQISAHQLVPYANGIACLFPDTNESVQELNLPTGLLEWKYKIVFTAFLPWALGSIFGLLLVSFLLFQFLQYKGAELNTEYEAHQFDLTRLSQLEKRLNQQRTLANSYNAEQYGFISFYADRIASIVGDKIKLTSLNINPQEKKQHNAERDFIFMSNKVSLSGICTKPSDLNEFLTVLKKQNFIQEIDDQTYYIDQFTKQGRFNFNLTVKHP